MISDATMVLDALEAYFQRQQRAPIPCAKVAYTSIEAKAALARLRRRRHAKRHAERRSYKCWSCGWYHLTSESR